MGDVRLTPERVGDLRWQRNQPGLPGGIEVRFCAVLLTNGLPL